MVDEVDDRNGVRVIETLVGLWIWAKEPIHPFQNSELVVFVLGRNSINLGVE